MLARYLSIGSVSLAAVLALFSVHALEGQWTWVAHMDDNLIRHVPQLSAEALPIPVAFLLWAHLMEKTGKKFALNFSPFFTVLSIEFLTVGQALGNFPELKRMAFVAGVVTGLFVLAPIQECWRRVKKDPRPAIVALIAATAAINYYFLLNTIWEQICGWTAATVHALLSIFQMDIASRVVAGVKTALVLTSPHFNIAIMPGCSGLEGIFLFNFMLSVVLLLDWELFKHRSIVLLYLFGIIYMFFFNVLRLSMLFTLGYWAYRPDAWHWVQGFRGAPIDMFHSYVGWVFYLAAFGIFAAWLYRPTSGQQLSVNSSQLSVKKS